MNALSYLTEKNNKKMKQIFLSIFILHCIAFTNLLSAQCPPPGAPVFGDICGLAPLFCGDLDGYCNTINANDVPQLYFFGCPNSIFNNDEWISFVAGSSTINFEFTTSNCMNESNPTSLGLQAGIYYDCTGIPLDTQCGCVQGTFNLTSDDFIPGEVYIMVIDGCSGAICDYEIEIIEGSTGGGPEAPAPIDGMANVCPGDPQTYSIPPALAATEYIWTINPPFGSIIGATDQTSVVVNWTTPGTAVLCVETSNICETNPVPSCITVTNEVVPFTFEEHELCLGQSVICAGQSYSVPGAYNVNFTSWLGCDSIVTCLILPVFAPPTFLPPITLCAPNSINICNQIYNSSGIYSSSCISYLGCDSSVTVNLAILDPLAAIAPPGIIGCGANSIIQLDGSASNFTTAPFGNTTISWTGPSILSDPTEAIIDIDASGTYCLELTHERDGVECTDMICVDVTEDIATPDPPFLSGLDFVCDGDFETYTATFLSGAVPIDYTWTSPNGEPIIQIDPTTISIDWFGSMGGELCVTANNDCGASTPACLTIIVNAAPVEPSLSGEAIVCEGIDAFYQIGNVDPNAIYNWTVPNGASFNDLGNGSISVNFNGATSGDVCVTANNSCGNSPENCFPVTVINTPPTPTFTSGDTDLCDGAVETYCVLSLPEADDYTWTSPIGTITGSNCQTIDWAGFTGGQVCVSANNSCGASQIICIDVIVNQNPTATLSGSGSFCENSGDLVDLSITLTGTSPWTVDYSVDNLAQTPLVINSSPYTLSASTAGTYELVDVNDQTGCPGLANGMAEVTENPLPTASISGSGAICQGSGNTVNLSIALTGAPNWMVNWAVDGNPQAALDIAASPFTLTIGSAQAGNITITDVTDGNACFNTSDGSSATVLVKDAPMVGNIQTTCNGASTAYVLTFEITGGDPNSYSVTGGAGNITATPPYIFTSDEILSGEGYAFTINDINNCNPILVEDIAVPCDCITDVGSMDQLAIAECGDGPIDAIYDNGHTLDSDDVLNFILHEGSGLSILNPITNNNSNPSFSYVAPMVYGTIYYISAVVGDDLGNGTVDLNDPCLAVAQGTPVQFFEIPTAEISGADSICIGEQGSLIVNFTGIAPWNIEYSDGIGNPVTVDGITANPFTLNITPASTSEFSLVSVSDDNCPGTVSGIGNVDVHTGVEISNVQTTCNPTNTAFVISFEINAGDENSYEVTGVNGSISSTAPFIFTSEEILSGQGYNLIISDVNDCDPQSLVQTIVLCDCSTQVGTMASDAEEICGDGPFLATYDSTGGNGENLDGDDILQYVLHTTSTNLGTILQNNDTAPSFGFQAPMEYGTTYYVSAIIGSNDGLGNIDLSDPCLAVAAGTPLTFFEIPTAFISGDAAICESENTNLIVDLTGDSPWSITINGETISGINSNPFMYPVAPNATTTYSISELSDENCPGAFNGDAVVMVNTPPAINNLQVTCNATSTAFTVSFDIIGGDPNCYEVTGPAGQIMNNQFISNEIPTGNSFQFFLDDCNGCGPIVIEQALVICDCDTEAGNMEGLPIEACGNNPAIGNYLGGEVLDPDDVVCYFLHAGDNAPIATNPSEPSFTFNPGIMNYDQTYFLCAAVGNDNGAGCVNFSDPCLAISNCTEVVFYEEPTASLTGEIEICQGQQAEITFDLTGTAPWTIEFQNVSSGEIFTESNIVDNQAIISVSPASTALFNILSISDANCNGSFFGSTIVNVNNPPTIDNLSFTCNGNNTFYTVSFEIQAGDEATYQIFPANSGTLSPTPPYIFTSNDIDVNSGYSFQVDDANACGPILVEQASILCDCITDAGSLDLNAILVCETDTANGIHNADETLDGDDILRFVLHDQAGSMLGNIISTNTIPEFSFDPASMDLGVLYYLCAIAGNDDGTGNIDFSDPCLSIECGIPVLFNALPTLDISGDATICNGESTMITFNMTGVGPFNIEYIDGDGMNQNLTDVNDGATILVSPTDNANFTTVSIEDTGTGCSNMSNDFVTILVSQPVNAGISEPSLEVCEGDGDVIQLNSLLTNADSGGTWTDGNGNILNPPIFQIIGQQTGTHNFIYLVDADEPCTDEFSEVSIIIHELPVADAGIDQELNCGVESVELGGAGTSVGNFTYAWTGPMLLPANTHPIATQSGVYTLTVTNNITGCISTDEVEVELNLASLVPSITISDVGCFGNADGFIQINEISGGEAPYLCSFNGGPFTDETSFTNLSGGQYSIICKDSKDCSIELEINIEEPEELNVTLQGDFDTENNSLLLGDSLNITVEVNVPFDSLDAVVWTPNGIIPCGKCDDFYIHPLSSLTIGIMIEENGCTAFDEIAIQVLKNHEVYVPNAFSPNEDGLNDKLNIFSGASVAKIKSFMVFNRWGESVFQFHNFDPNDLSIGWDGTFKGEKMNPGVFIWFAEVEFVDGAVEIFEGDVMVMR